MSLVFALPKRVVLTTNWTGWGRLLVPAPKQVSGRRSTEGKLTPAGAHRHSDTKTSSVGCIPLGTTLSALAQKCIHLCSSSTRTNLPLLSWNSKSVRRPKASCSLSSTCASVQSAACDRLFSATNHHVHSGDLHSPRATPARARCSRLWGA